MPVNADPSRTIKEYVNGNPDLQKKNQRWWLDDDDRVFESVFHVALIMHQNLSERSRQNFLYARNYNDESLSSGLGSGDNAMQFDSTSNGMSLNVIQNCIDSACAMISKNKPKPQFITDGAEDYSKKIRAKKLTKYVSGVFDDCKLYEIAQRVFTDACIYGTGALKLYSDGERICAEWCFIEEILVDGLDGLKEDPYQIHQRKYVSKDALCAEYPKHIDLIMACTGEKSGQLSAQSTSDTVCVIESWHRRSGKRAKDGRHTICIENATLLAEDYKKDYFPIKFFRWYHQSSGFFGRGISQEIWKQQKEINKILRTIQLAQELVAVPVIFIEASSMVAEDHMASNEVGRFVEYVGQPPIIATPPAVQPELYSYVQYLEDRCYKIIGLNQQNATGTKQPGITSGAAIREVQDIASGRFEVIGQNWEAYFMDMARNIVDMSKDLFSGDKDLQIRTKDKKTLSTIKWKDVDIELDEFDIQLFPVSGLPNTPAGRIESIESYTANGWIQKEQAMDLLDFPDLEGFTSPETGTIKLVNEIISNIKEDGISGYRSPSAYMNLQNAFNIAKLEVVNAELQHVPEEHIDLIRKFAEETDDLIKLAQQTAQQQQAASQPQQPAAQAANQPAAQAA
jgi:hypothetical protein